jgi:hypothetical protein
MITVICRDFSREHPPIRYILNIDSREIAIECISKRAWIKEILDAGSNIEWNKETVMNYWKSYYDKPDERKITKEYLDNIPNK